MISERRACAALGQHRSTQRKIPRGREDEEKLTDDLVALAREHGRLGYRKIAAMLRNTSGWVVNDKRVEPEEHKKFVAAEMVKIKAAVDAAGKYAD